MAEKIFYIYGLYDPTENEVFYIGKGSGNRLLNHFKKNKWDFNSSKKEKIEEIREKGIEPVSKILFDQLSEEEAYVLEKELINRIGRSPFCEGPLSNLAPGGRWKKGDNPFFSEDFILDNNPTLKKYESKLSRYGKKKVYSYLNNNSNSIYRYDKSGELFKVYSLEELFKGKIEGAELKLLSYLNKESLPIVHRNIYSSKPIKKLNYCFDIPNGEYDVFDSEFHREFIEKSELENKFEISSVQNGITRVWIEKSNSKLSYKAYHPNGKLKSLRTKEAGKLIDKSIDFNEKGTKIIEVDHIGGNSNYIRTTFFSNGHPHIEVTRIDGANGYKRWLKNGDLEISR